LHRFRLQVASGDRLMLYTLNERTSLQATTTEDLGWAPLVLLGNVKRLELRYFGPDRFTGTDGWQTEWLSRGALPKLVQVRAIMGREETRSWPLLIVRPGAQSHLPCRDGSTTQDCGEKN
jgi:hypothetical protein